MNVCAEKLRPTDATFRKSRELCRSVLGPDNVTFVVMNLSKSCQMRRLQARHGESKRGAHADILAKMHDLYEPAGDDEEGVHNLTVTEEMTPDDVLKKAIELIAAI